MLHLVYHKHNAIFTTFVDGSFFKKIFMIITWEKNEDIIFTQLLQ